MANITGVVEFNLGTTTLTVGETIETEPYAFEKTAVTGFSRKINRQKKPAIQKITVQIHMDENYDQQTIEDAEDETISIVIDNGRRITMREVEYEGTPTENHADGMAEVEFTGVFVENKGID